MWWSLRMKKFNFMGDHWKIQFLGEVQKGSGRVCKFKRRFGEKEEGGVCVCVCVCGGFDTPSVIQSFAQNRYQAFSFQNYQQKGTEKSILKWLLPFGQTTCLSSDISANIPRLIKNN